MKRILYTILIASPIAWLIHQIGMVLLYFPLVTQESGATDSSTFFYTVINFLADYLTAIAILIGLGIAHMVLLSFEKIAAAKRQQSQQRKK